MAALRKYIQKIDLFRRIDEDYLASATAHGGTFTLMAYMLMAVLAVFELSAWLSSMTSTTVLMDMNMEQSLMIKFNITMLALPCYLLVVGVYDKFGWAAQNLQFDLDLTHIHMAHGKYVDGPKAKKSHMSRELGVWDHVPEESDNEVEVDWLGHHALDLTGVKAFDEELLEYDYTLMNFYTPWCHWCKAMASTYEKAADEFDTQMRSEQKTITAKFASLNCERYGDVCSRYKVRAYPTLLIFHKEGPVYPIYDGDRTVNSLVKFLKDAVVNAETSIPDTLHDHACRIEGSLTVARVPGTFSIEARSSDHDISAPMANLSHIVHNLQFGEILEPSLTRRLPRNQRLLMHPLDGEEFILSKIHMAPQHYIQIVTTLYEFEDGTQINSYQFTSQNRIAEYAAKDIPEAKFVYDLSPVSVIISQRKKPFYSFITSLLAIVGGAFTVISLLDIAVSTVGVQLKKNLGKFS